LREGVVLDGDQVPGTFDGLGGQGDHLVCLQSHLAAGDLAHAQFGALEVRQQSHRPSDFVGGGADGLHVLPVLRLVPVGEVDAGRVHTGLNQGAECVRLCTGWPDGANDFGMQWHDRLPNFCLMRWGTWYGLLPFAFVIGGFVEPLEVPQFGEGQFVCVERDEREGPDQEGEGQPQAQSQGEDGQGQGRGGDDR